MLIADVACYGRSVTDQAVLARAVFGEARVAADRYPLLKACIASHCTDLEAEFKQREQARESIDAAVSTAQQVLFKSDAN